MEGHVCVWHVMTKHVHVMTHGCQRTMWGFSSFFPLGRYQDGNQVLSLSNKGLWPLCHLPSPGLPQFWPQISPPVNGSGCLRSLLEHHQHGSDTRRMIADVHLGGAQLPTLTWKSQHCIESLRNHIAILHPGHDDDQMGRCQQVIQEATVRNITSFGTEWELSQTPFTAVEQRPRTLPG